LLAVLGQTISGRSAKLREKLAHAYELWETSLERMLTEAKRLGGQGRREYGEKQRCTTGVEESFHD